MELNLGLSAWQPSPITLRGQPGSWVFCVCFQFMKGCCVWDLAAGTNHSVFLADSSGMKPDIFYCGKQPGFVSILLSVSVWIELGVMFFHWKENQWVIKPYEWGGLFCFVFLFHLIVIMMIRKRRGWWWFIRCPGSTLWVDSKYRTVWTWDEKYHCTLRQGLPLEKKLVES